MKMKNSLGKLSVGALLALGALGQACGGDDDVTPSGDGDGDSPATTGGSTSTGGMTAAGGTPAGTGGGMNPPPAGGPGQAVGTPIPSGTVVVTAGHGADPESGFEGFFWTATDMDGSTIFPADFSNLSEAEETENKVCVNGATAQVLDETKWATTWGAQVGWGLGQGPEDTEGTTVDISGTTGIQFTIEQAVSASMRFQIAIGDDVYCTTASAGENTILWSELTLGCWEAGGEAFDPSAHMVKDVSWSVPASDQGPIPFDFCVGGIDILGDGGGVGGQSN